VGKTSLAKAAARRASAAFPDGVFLIELASLTDSSLLPATIGSTLGCLQGGARTSQELVAEWLAARHVLLVLDNCEHLAVGKYAQSLLEACPDLHILATSRAPLHIAAEVELAVSLLSIPDLQRLPPAADFQCYSATNLFLQRGREVLRGFEVTEQNRAAVAEICTRLDGLPLAIELAAARLKLLSPQALLERLKTNSRLLAARRTDIPQRQQTLRQAIAWSNDLLSPHQQEFFRRLAVFSGGFTLEAAEIVAGEGKDVVDELAALVENSLLRRDADPASDRFALLETIREFAMELLQDSGEADALGRRHASWVKDLAETCEPLLRGPEAQAAMVQLQTEHANVRAAFAWCLAAPGDASRGEVGLRIAGALWRFWCTGGHLREAQGWLSQLLAAFGARGDGIEANARYAGGCVAEDLGDFAQARALYEEALRLWDHAGQKTRLSDAHIALGSIDTSQGDYAAATDHFQCALTLAQKHGDQRAVSVALSNLGSTAWAQGDYVRAREYHEGALTIRRQIGNRTGVAVSLTSLGLICSRLGDLTGANILYEESLSILRELGNQPGIAVCLNNLGEISYRLGEYESGEVMLWEALRIQYQIGDQLSLAYTLESLAAAAWLQGSGEAAVRFFAAAETLRETMGAPLPPPEQASNDKIILEVRIALGPEQFSALWTAAKTIPLEKIVAEPS
jgi:non-specific serine/threonine protein kinase